jgi:5-methylcytosine-specific restriction endonuclease McrA
VSFDYNAPRWRRVRASVLRRDGYLCRYCLRYGRRRPATTVHHIEHADEHPELAYNADNLISLCEACHNKMHPEKAKNAGRYGI